MTDDTSDKSPVAEVPREHPNPERLRYYANDYGDYHMRFAKSMPGKVLANKADAIAAMVEQLRVRRTDVADEPIRLLDYGSGKGYQYLKRRIQDRWGGILPYCYDPGVIHLQERPTGLFDGVICTDVLEHIEQRDLKDVLSDIFQFLYTDRPTFAFLHVCCRPAHKHFSDGRNFHATIKPPKWWKKLIEPFPRPAETMLKLSFETAKRKGPEHAVTEVEADPGGVAP